MTVGESVGSMRICSAALARLIEWWKRLSVRQVTPNGVEPRYSGQCRARSSDERAGHNRLWLEGAKRDCRKAGGA
jgi:hypothetical protein